MTEPILVARGQEDCLLLPALANRHGLVAGATGTGKTVSLQTIAEAFSRIGVPVFAADVKGDLSGVSQAGGGNKRVDERIQKLALTDFDFNGSPVAFWDVFGEKGHPIRTTVSEMGPLLISRLLNLNDTQSGVLNIAFRVADDQGLLLLDLKDLRSMIQFVGESASELTTKYGNVSAASVGAIQRSLLVLEEQGGERLFGEPALDLFDLIQTTPDGRGVINILAADKLMESPRTYATLLLWLLSELFESLPEVGDLEKPKLVFFFDEAYLLFEDMPEALGDKIEQVVRLIRSKGVGIYFVTQNPIDVPDKVLAQLGNRVQHALRAFTPREQRAIDKASETFRPNPAFEVQDVITELEVGEALISLLDPKGAPGITQRAYVLPPHGRIGPATDAERAIIVSGSLLAGHYEAAADRESAYEKLTARAAATAAEEEKLDAQKAAEKKEKAASGSRSGGRRSGGGRRSDSVGEAMAKSTARSIGTSLGRGIVRSILGTLFRKK